jgi:hypothetical protein
MPGTRSQGATTTLFQINLEVVSQGATTMLFQINFEVLMSAV